MSDDQKTANELKRLHTHIASLEADVKRLRKRDWSYQLLFDRVSDGFPSDWAQLPDRPGRFEGLSFVICYHDIPRQIERTLLSCSPAYQGVAETDLEVILVDNGSSLPLPDDLAERFPHVREIIRVDGHPSPVVALNRGIAAARFEAIALMIDGAHILSPGIVRNTRDVWALFANPVVSVPQFILGRESQNLTQTVEAFEVESAELAQIGWPKDGYAIYNYAVYPGENPTRSYVDGIETNCLITTRRVLETCGAFDERFDEPGGGFANLEIFSRLIDDPRNSYIVFPGEGSFHQDHRGTTTHRSPEEREALVQRYKQRFREVTGTDTVLNGRSPFLFGKTRRLTQAIPTISREFGKVTHQLQRKLANFYVGRIRAGITDGPRPALALGGAPDERLARPPLAPAGLLPSAAERQGIAEKELDYLDCLRRVHSTLQPRLYFEIGIDTGASLRLAACRSIGVDPAYQVSSSLTQPCRLFRQTSDAFFANEKRCGDLFRDGIELAFIDGMHLAEYVLRDFIVTERWMRRDGVVLFDDVLPEQMPMLERERRFAAWCGDVFKIVPILRRYRPELRVSVFETFIGPYRKGLALVTGLDPENRVLDEHYDEIAADIAAGRYDVADIAALDDLLAPQPLLNLEHAVLGARVDLAAAMPREESARGERIAPSPRLSVVVVSYDMARELPRTLQTLGAGMQRGIAEADYEIIVVDNGSTTEPDWKYLAAVAPNARFFRRHDANASPCGAANLGISAARGAYVGVLIDGARMASPGLLASSLQALENGDGTVVGAHSLHLGQMVQQEAVAAGHDETAEDALLDSSNWNADGYRLFEIAVLSKSSGKGWRTLPSESNAVFMANDRWRALNGFDERFRSPGGGLANLDLWKRACEAPGNTVALLLGEATFHQLHGGVSTNAATSPRAAFDTEYEALRGRPFARPTATPTLIGAPPAAMDG
ncbi:MAG: glycosyltransferase [Pseudomonadota bacterium]